MTSETPLQIFLRACRTTAQLGVPRGNTDLRFAYVKANFQDVLESVIAAGLALDVDMEKLNSFLEPIRVSRNEFWVAPKFEDVRMRMLYAVRQLTPPVLMHRPINVVQPLREPSTAQEHSATASEVAALEGFITRLMWEIPL